MEIICTGVKISWGTKKKDGTPYQFATVFYSNQDESSTERYNSLIFGEATDEVGLFFDSKAKLDAFVDNSNLASHTFPCHARLLSEVYVQGGRANIRFTGLELLSPLIDSKKAA